MSQSRCAIFSLSRSRIVVLLGRAEAKSRRRYRWFASQGRRPQVFHHFLFGVKKCLPVFLTATWHTRHSGRKPITLRLVISGYLGAFGKAGRWSGAVTSAGSIGEYGGAAFIGVKSRFTAALRRTPGLPGTAATAVPRRFLAGGLAAASRRRRRRACAAATFPRTYRRTEAAARPPRMPRFRCADGEVEPRCRPRRSRRRMTAASPRPRRRWRRFASLRGGGALTYTSRALHFRGACRTISGDNQ